MSRRVRKPGTSEQPDLRAERETFVRSFLNKGLELSEELLRENQGLHAQVRKLEEDNTRLLTLQQELDDLASLYVASFQLGSSRSVRHVVRHICELLEQLIGVQSFVVYTLSADGKRAQPIASGGCSGKLESCSVLGGPLGEVCMTGVARVFDPVPAGGTDEPIAVVPLLFDSVVVAVIAVHKLLPHKQTWALVDHELFKLLSARGASALIGANLYAKAAGPRAALRGVAAQLEREQAARAVATRAVSACSRSS